MKPLKLKGTYASINLDNVIHNYMEACRLAGDSVKVSCVVKSDAYGHGDIQVVKALAEEGLTIICVDSMAEAIRLRKAFSGIDILILGYTPGFLAGKAAEYNLIQTISTLEEARTLNAKGGVSKVHIKVNTGMNRMGFSPNSIDDIAAISGFKHINICGIFTHLHSSDKETPTIDQFEKFEGMLGALDNRGIQTGVRHMCNSGGLIAFKSMHMDMVREGIMLYGLYPSKSTDRNSVRLKECMELHSIIAQVMDIKKGDGISYGHSFVAPKDMRIATVNLGYSDGVFRQLSNRGEVIIHNSRRPIVGTVCMNMFMVDITGMENVQVEDEVIVFGRSNNQFISIDEVAEWAGTISYDITCRTGYSVPRVYCRNGEIVECEQELLIETGKIKSEGA